METLRIVLGVLAILLALIILIGYFTYICVMAPVMNDEGEVLVTPGLQAMSFEEMNTSIAEKQEQYKTLPALVINNEYGEVITCWEVPWRERVQILFTGRIWLSVWTFKSFLQPLFMTTVKSDLIRPNTK